MPTFKPAYLVLGDDHGRIAERRSELRALAEAESGSAASRCSRATSARPRRLDALNAMTFGMGRRFIVVEGVERWREEDLHELEAALGAMHAEGQRDDHFRLLRPRGAGAPRAPKRLHEAVVTARAATLA